MTLSTERLLPGIIAALVTAGAFFLAAGHEVAIAGQLANPVLTMVSICIGFLAAAVTILLTASIPAIKQLTTCPGHFKAYVGYHWSAMLWGFLSAISSLALIVLSTLDGTPTKADVLFRILFLAWTFCTVLALAALYRVVYLLRALLHTLSEG